MFLIRCSLDTWVLKAPLATFKAQGQTSNCGCAKIATRGKFLVVCQMQMLKRMILVRRERSVFDVDTDG